MKKKTILFILLLIIVLCHCSNQQFQLKYDQWNVSQIILSQGPKGMFDNIAVKDPSMVFFKGKYHLFYTSKTVQEYSAGIQYITGLGYISAKSLDQLNDAKRYDINAMVNDVIIAPQIFFFEPQNLWYIIAYTRVNNGSRLAPVYMTNPEIENGNGWSKPRLICESRPNSKFWIDFWVICDKKSAYMFYTDQEGALLRMQIPIDEFPNGFSSALETEVYAVKGENEKGKWRLYDACHVYHVKKTGKYLALIEGAYPHPKNPFYWDARNRFQFALTADSLNGKWTRVEGDKNSFFIEAGKLIYPPSFDRKFSQVSHPEIIRSGYNQEMEIKDFNIDILFQGIDAEEISDDYNYNELPWVISLAKNY